MANERDEIRNPQPLIDVLVSGQLCADQVNEWDDWDTRPQYTVPVRRWDGTTRDIRYQDYLDLEDSPGTDPAMLFSSGILASYIGVPETFRQHYDTLCDLASTYLGTTLGLGTPTNVLNTVVVVTRYLAYDIYDLHPPHTTRLPDRPSWHGTWPAGYTYQTFPELTEAFAALQAAVYKAWGGDGYANFANTYNNLDSRGRYVRNSAAGWLLIPPYILGCAVGFAIYNDTDADADYVLGIRCDLIPRGNIDHVHVPLEACTHSRNITLRAYAAGSTFLDETVPSGYSVTGLFPSQDKVRETFTAEKTWTVRVRARTGCFGWLSVEYNNETAIRWLSAVDTLEIPGAICDAELQFTMGPYSQSITCEGDPP